MNERQKQIVELIERERRITVGELARTLYVSDATVRRDLSLLERQGVLRRTHGGAVREEGAEEISLYVRMEENARAKERLAQRALPLVPEFKTLFLDSSSTALALVRKLPLAHKTVVTSNLESALLLSKTTEAEVIVLGGVVVSSSSSVRGSIACAGLREFRFDVMISSAAAIADGGSYESSLEQRELKRVAFEHASYRILLADASKFRARGAYLMRKTEDFDLFVTDRDENTTKKE